MSDEIDIEEHDLLDDPAIKNIFPDLSKLKQEILDYYEEEPDDSALTFQTDYISEINNYEDSNVSASPRGFDDKTQSLDDFLDNSKFSEVDPHNLTTEKTQVQLFSNKIISVTNHEDCNVTTSLNVYKDDGLLPDNLLDNSQDNEIRLNHVTTEKIQVQMVNNKIKLTTKQKNCNISPSLNGFESDGLLDKGSDLESNHLTTEKPQVSFFENKIILATDHEVCNTNTSSDLTLGNLMNHSQGSDSRSIDNKITLGTEHGDKRVITSLNYFEEEGSVLDTSLDNSQGSEVDLLQFTEEKTQMCNNKILLGLKHVQDKTKYYEKRLKLHSAVVKVVECGDYLNNSSRYCRDCRILFPKKIDYDFHYQLIHLASEMAPAITTETPSIIPATQSVVPPVTRRQNRTLNKNKLALKGNATKHKCSSCNAVFTFSSNLSRHFKNVHNMYRPQLSKINKKKTIRQDQNTKAMVKNNECFHCKKVFKDQKSLIEHIYSILQKPTGGVETTGNKNNINQKSGNVLIKKDKKSQPKNSEKQGKKGNNTVMQKIKKLTIKNIGKKAEKGSKPINQTKKNPGLKSPKVDQGETFYRCHYCNYYFKQIQFYAAHVKNKHQLVKVPKVKKIPFNPKCKFCHSVYSNVITFNAHLHKRHTAKLKENIAISKTMKTENKINNLKKATSTINKKTTLDVFRCCYCSYYYVSVKCYTKHIIRKHKVQKIPNAKKISFDPKCKYCPKISSNIRAYNKHLSGSHSKRLHEVFKITSRDQSSSVKHRVAGKVTKVKKYYDNAYKKQYSLKNVRSDIVTNDAAPESKRLILKSALFKCNKCDIHFLSLNQAVDHSNHMELLINWKCVVCHKILKKTDKQLHEKQHSMSNVFTVYEISETDVPRVLYKCSKCTIHFDENNYMNHTSDCTLKTPQSAYCKVCDILVTKSSTKSHENKHKLFKPNDFLIIESDFIFHTELKKINGSTCTGKISSATPSKLSDVRKTKKLNYFLTQMYCNTCKCFVSNMGGTRKVHVQSACSHMTRHTCLHCGLTLTNKAMVTHQPLHSIKRDLKLQDYTFYDLRSGKQINPPIPNYHKCETCNVHFISKIIMKRHLCHEKEYKTCQFCEIKLSKPIYHIHMAFHSYSMTKVNTTRLKKYKTSSEISEISESNIPTPNKFLKRSLLNFVFNCNNCNTTVDTYDMMIEHCQKHSTNNNIVPYTKECQICNLNIHNKCYTAHTKLHQTMDKIRIEKLSYDLFYFKFGSDVWLPHVFGSRPQEQIEEVLKKSIYRSEHRIKMQILQDGISDYTMYKCHKCNSIIEPDNIYKHTDVMCVKLRKYPCSACGLSFISTLSRMNHEKYHERPDFSSKSYRIVLFNNIENSNLHPNSVKPQEYYTFYQCRKCSGIVDKSYRTDHICTELQYENCTYCGLLFNRNDYDSHLTKHRMLNSFVSKNMKVVLFGQNNSHSIGTGGKSEAFHGIIYDYNFMKCIHCQICEKDAKINHDCAYDNSRIKCSKCCIYLHSHALNSHHKKHETDPDFVIENMNFIDFDPKEFASNNENKVEYTRSDQELVNEESGNESKIISGETELEISHPAMHNEDLAVHKTAKIYKCPCGLHFLDEVTLETHLDQCGSKIKQAKQNCFKCGLLFTPKVLFSHVLSHHGDIKKMFKYDIIDVPKKS